MGRLEAALRDLRLADTLAARDTPVSRLDPRAKVLVTAAFLVAVASFNRYALSALAPFALYPLWLAVAGRVPAGWLARKLAIAAPFAAMVAIANPILNTAPMLRLADATVSAGWVSFASILARVGLTIAAALAVAAGTGMHALAAALAALGVPRIFTGQLLFLWRYAFVLGGEASRMQAARTLRGGRGSPALAVYGPLAGHLLLRAFERGERIHRAMRARGYDGEIRTLRELRWQVRDTVFVLGWCAYFALARSVDLPLALGRAITGAP